MIGQQQLRGFIAEAGGQHGSPSGVGSQEMVRQHYHIGSTLAQRWNLQDHSGQTKIKIFTKTPLFNLALKVTVCGGNHAHVDLFGLGGSDSVEIS